MLAKNQRIVMTGGSGFIGLFLVDRLLSEGYGNIVAINAHHPCARKEVQNVISSISDTATMRGTLQEGDVVLHLACSSTPLTAESNRVRNITEDLVGSVSLFETCVEKRVSRCIYLSSGGTVYGSREFLPAKESDPTNPIGSYGALKLSIEKYMGVFTNLYGLQTTTIRLANPYGRLATSGRLQGAVDIFLEKMQTNEPIRINGDGNIVRDYIYIDDTIEFLLHAIRNKDIAGIYNLGTGTGTSLNELVATLGKVFGKTPSVQRGPEKGFDLPYAVVDIAKARATGWKPVHTLESGVRAILARTTL